MAKIIFCVIALLFWAVLIISFAIDRSRYRNCYLLFFALVSSIFALSFFAGDYQKPIIVILMNLFLLWTFPSKLKLLTHSKNYKKS